MSTAFRTQRIETRRSERIRVHASIQLSTTDGVPLAPLARCTEIGLGGVRVRTTRALAPGTSVRLSVRLPRGLRFEIAGRVAWSRQTIHPALFGAPGACDDDAEFGIAFAPTGAEQLLPIARLFAARDSERRRAHRIRRLHGLPIRA
jgi:hypothetical protein